MRKIIILDERPAEYDSCMKLLKKTIIYLRILHLSQINFRVDIFPRPKFSMTLRRNIPANFQYFPSNSLHFMHLSKLFQEVTQFAWTYFFKIFFQAKKVNIEPSVVNVKASP